MKRFIGVLLILAWCPLSLQSQINHSVWYGRINMRSNSLLLPICSNMISNGINGMVLGFQAGKAGMTDSEKIQKYVLERMPYSLYNRWLPICPAYDIHFPFWKLYDANGEIATQGPDWWRCLLFGDFRHNYNFSLGYSLHWRSYDIPLGVNVGVNYEWRGLCVKEGTLAGLHRTSGIVPAAELRWFVLGNSFEREYRWNIVAEAGASYVKTLCYNDPLQLGKDKVNDGWRGHAALGFLLDRILYCNIFLKYEWDCFNYFNIPQIESRMSNVVIASFERVF